MKQMLIAGNWKMHTNAFESRKLAEYIAGGLIPKGELIPNVLVCPPFTSLESVSDALKGTRVRLGAQNCHFESKGAYTGEISVPMIRHLRAGFIICGHSERRHIFGESDETINRKVLATVEGSMTAILCIGETLDERKAGKTFDVLRRQLDEGLKNVEEGHIFNIVIAYEPVWAIGTGESASRDQINEAHKWIRKYYQDKIGGDAGQILILYGGSMNPKNAEEILSIPDVNGGLIGGASLDADSFLSIIATAENILKQ
ncbi:MAG: triose-phosphate isomerase [Candidatus Kapaibacterium sp.]